MRVNCVIVNSDAGIEGVIVGETGRTLYKTGFHGCAEDADAELAGVILARGYEANPPDRNPFYAEGRGGDPTTHPDTRGRES